MEENLQQFSETFNSEFSVDTPINSLWTSFKSKGLSSINKHVPSKMTSSRYSQSWCNRTVRRLSRRKQRAFRRPGRTATRRTGPDTRIYRRPARKNVGRHTTTTSVIWSVMNQAARLPFRQRQEMRQLRCGPTKERRYYP